MQKNTLLFVIIALFAGFVGGFWLANSINRSATTFSGPQQGPGASSNSDRTQAEQEFELSDDEIKAKITEADNNPANFTFQKGLGIALYHYAVMKKNPRLFPEAVRILERANSLNAKDFDVLVALGNAHFDLGFAEKNLSGFQNAREIYSKALEIKPDENVQTDVGISYVVQEPPAYDKAVSQLQKVLDKNPDQERALIYLTRAFIGQNKIPDAERSLAKLQSVDPQNEQLPELTSLISNAQSGANK